MAKKEKEKKQVTNDEAQEESFEEVEDVEPGDDVIVDEETAEEPEEAVNLQDIPIDQFFKDSSLINYSDEVDSEEATYWCPQCTDNTLFIDRVCTVCGYSKTIKKNTKEDELDEMESAAFEIPTVDEDLSYLNIENFEDNESYD